MKIRLISGKHNVTITDIENITNIDIYDGDIVIEYGRSCTMEVDANVFDINDIINQLTAHMDILTEELIDNLILMNEIDEADLDYTDVDIIAITGEVPSYVSDELNKHGIFDWEVVNVIPKMEYFVIDDIEYNLINWDFSMYDDFIIWTFEHPYIDFTEYLTVYRFSDCDINVIVNREIKGN